MSDLQKRLTHLVNYSSQLIFVGSDAVADQQKYLTDFLSQQGDHTEVSFFTAKQNEKSVDHRRTICRQLADHQVGSFIRPIGELLAELPDSNNTNYLICIAQADNIANDFLEELWQWIASIRKSTSTLHLNVILFGSAHWAETAQNWLPQQNHASPVLLSSHSVDAVGFDVNALESLMAQKRAFFAGKGIFGTSGSESFVNRRWFISTVMCTFFVVFSALIAWQYPAEVKAFIDSGEIPENVDLSIVPTPKETDTDDIILDTTDTSLNSITDELLVSDWQVYVEETKNKTDSNAPHEDDTHTNNLASSQTNSNAVVQEEAQAQGLTAQLDEQLVINDDAKAHFDVSTSNNEALVNEVVADAEGDFQVPDILSIEQLDAKLGQTILLDDPEYSVADNQETAATFNESTEESTLAPVDTSPIDQYRFDEALLLQLPSDLVVLQLSGIQNPRVLETYIRSNNLSESTWIYQTERYGGPWYVVLYNDTFDSIDAALSTAGSLPESIKSAQPFAKSIAQIRSEITQ
ncbi:hypothetical protein GCM10007852_32200 [Agaribacter marinus]|uniref:DamX protein n=1 Tax=Agaribacter marinus TaxID=1431249 RepID=A0AA37SYF7_9ALTE|nr:hypothetical protein GCM10007852_32200 [Agaribacter marinus]